MKKFKLLIEGSNALIRIDHEIGKYGFFTTRFIEAKNARDAEISAMNLIKEELKPILLNNRSDPPVIHAEETSEIHGFGNNIVPGEGFTWFEEEETIH